MKSKDPGFAPQPGQLKKLSKVNNRPIGEKIRPICPKVYLIEETLE
jgi:hypothetical protein